ncbi:Putative ribonuclease H protein At1g65750 [Linum perenne]
MAWERTCVRKEAQGWKFQTQPNALVTRIFKARYFPRGDFLSAPKGNGPSYVWQSIRRTQVVTERDETLAGLKVADLLIPGCYEWDHELIEGIFEQRDVQEILNVPLGVGGQVDKLIWHYDEKGNYTVRSAYRVLMNFIHPRPDLVADGARSQIWSLQVPLRIKTYIWRLARSVIPTREVLRRRHIAVLVSCGVCAGGSEDYNHLFFDCHFAEDC